ncbi:MAG TPA: hypothetical protein VGG88_13065 [Gaiellaceae bacterium]
MSSVGRAAGRVLPKPRERTDGYAFCPADGFWFRPAYTEGKCPLCGEVAPEGVAASRLARMERSWLGTAGLVLESLAMLGLVLFLYFRG